LNRDSRAVEGDIVKVTLRQFGFFDFTTSVNFSRGNPMTAQGVKRKLTAILSANVKGYGLLLHFLRLSEQMGKNALL